MTYAYWNLHMEVWSLMEGGRVVDHQERVRLMGCEFRVREGGRQRVLRERGFRRVELHALQGFAPCHVVGEDLLLLIAPVTWKGRGKNEEGAGELHLIQLQEDVRRDRVEEGSAGALPVQLPVKAIPVDLLPTCLRHDRAPVAGLQVGREFASPGSGVRNRDVDLIRALAALVDADGTVRIEDAREVLDREGHSCHGCRILHPFHELRPTKNVHAFVVGEVVERGGKPLEPIRPGILVRYNPYEGGHFVEAETGRPVARAGVVELTPDRKVLAWDLEFLDPS